MKSPEVPLYGPPEYPDTYGDLIDWAIKRVQNPEQKVLFRISNTDVAITYAEFGRHVNRLSNFLVDAGVKKGDHVAVFLQNCLEYAYLYHALGKCGAIMSPINPFVKGDPLHYILRHSDPKYLVTSSDLFSDKIANVKGLLDGFEWVASVDKRLDVKGVSSVLLSDYTAYPSDFEPKWKITGDDIQGIWYTSGTTGVPKGAVMNQKTYIYRVLFFADYFRLTRRDVVYWILPMYHVAYVVWGGPLVMAAGGEIVQVPWFSASEFWKQVVDHKATVTFSTGTIIPILLKQPVSEEEKKGKEQLRLWVGWPVDDPQRVQERWSNIKFMEGYGTTELPVATISDYENPEFGSAGPPAPYTDLKIVDPKTGVELPKNKVGEIVCGHRLGPDYLIKAYYKDPEKTKETMRDGYGYTGDMGLLNDKGHLKFVDRIKDYLRVGGENVSSAVVEEVIRRHPAVMETAVIGIKGELGHDEIVAHVVTKEGQSIDPKEFFAFCDERMAYFMVPRFLVIREEFPKTSTLRIEKYRLREEKIPPKAFDRTKLGIVLKR